MVAYELCCLKVPFEAASINELIRKQKYTNLRNIQGYSTELILIIYEMLQVNPKKRTSADKIKAACIHNLKLKPEENAIIVDPLLDTIILP